MANRILKTGEVQITQGYKTSHKALDIVKYKSQLDDIIAHTAGTVVFCQTGQKNNTLSTGNASYGNCVKIDHGNGYYTLYAHLASVKVKLGQKVEQGQVLGRMGNTGRSFGAHLHWEVRKGNEKVDPTPYIDADLPKPVVDDKPHAKYSAYTNKWWGEITDCNDVNAQGYAGVQGKNMTALTAMSTLGTLSYRAHVKGGTWLSWISMSDKNNAKQGYAGIKGKAIDAIQMKLEGAPGYEVMYRVSPSANKGWYGWCTGLKDKTGDGYAGVFGNPIDCIQIKIERV